MDIRQALAVTITCFVIGGQCAYAQVYNPTPWANIAAYGGRADDGITDNGLALNSAIAALPPTGGTVYIPASGNGAAYVVATSVTPAKPVTLVCDSPSTTILRMAAPSAPPHSFLMFAPSSDFTITNCTIDGNQANQPGSTTFTGSGSNDATFTGTVGKHAYTVIIDGVSLRGAGIFKWSVDSGSYTTGVLIDGSAQALGANGVSVKFAKVTGHRLGDQWIFSSSAYSQATVKWTGAGYFRASGNIFQNGGEANLYLGDVSAQICPKEIQVDHNKFLNLIGHGGLSGQNSAGVFIVCDSAQDGISSSIEIHFNKFLQSKPSLNGTFPILMASNPPLGRPPINLSASITDNEFDGCGDNNNLGNPGGCILLYYNTGRTEIANNRFFNFVYAPIAASDSPMVDIHDNVIDGPAMSLISGNGYMAGAGAPNVGCIVFNSFTRPPFFRTGNPAYEATIHDNIIGNKYSLGCPGAGIDIEGESTSWVAGTKYSLGKIVRPDSGAPAAQQPYMFQVSSAGSVPCSGYPAPYFCGTTGVTRPNWPTTLNATVTDNQLIWTNIGPISNFPSRVSVSHNIIENSCFGMFIHGVGSISIDSNQINGSLCTTPQNWGSMIFSDVYGDIDFYHNKIRNGQGYGVLADNVQNADSQLARFYLKDNEFENNGLATPGLCPPGVSCLNDVRLSGVLKGPQLADLQGNSFLGSNIKQSILVNGATTTNLVNNTIPAGNTVAIGTTTRTDSGNSFDGGPASGTISIIGSTSGFASFSTPYVNPPQCTLTPTSDPTAVGSFWVTSTTTVVTAHVRLAGTIGFIYHCDGF